MKKLAFSAALLGIGMLIAGCPVYDGNDLGCFDDFDCPNGYVCDGGVGECVLVGDRGSSSCNAPGDCGSNETCSRSGTCMAGDCHFTSVGCVRGFECSAASGRWQCVPEGQGASNGGAPSESPADGGEPATSNGGAPASLGGAGAGG